MFLCPGTESCTLPFLAVVVEIQCDSDPHLWSLATDSLSSLQMG